MTSIYCTLCFFYLSPDPCSRSATCIPPCPLHAMFLLTFMRRMAALHRSTANAFHTFSRWEHFALNRASHFVTSGFNRLFQSHKCCRSIAPRWTAVGKCFKFEGSVMLKCVRVLSKRKSTTISSYDSLVKLQIPSSDKREIAVTSPSDAVSHKPITLPLRTTGKPTPTESSRGNLGSANALNDLILLMS